VNVDLVLDIASAGFLITGSLMSLAAALGMLRFPDLLARMHAATKPQVFGLLLLLIGLALQLRSWLAVPLLLIAWLFQLLTVPVSAHMVGRAGYRTKHLRKEILSVDDLDAVVEAAAAEEPGGAAAPGTARGREAQKEAGRTGAERAGESASVRKMRQAVDAEPDKD
jgi:multicomponent Na+:H+ antiporter subunit G